MHDDVYAIKFYAARDRHLDCKYNRIIRVHGYEETLKIFVACAALVPLLLDRSPHASFAINGARSIDFESGKIEGNSSNQRFRIYKTVALYLFGRKTFEYFQFGEVSSYLLVNRLGCEDITMKKEKIKEMFLSKYDFEL